MKIYKLFLVSAVLILSFAGCEDETENMTSQLGDTTLQEKIYLLFDDWYYWQDELPLVNPNSFASPFDLLEGLRNDVDRWSYIVDFETFQSLIQQGQFIGHGFSVKVDPDGKLRVSLVHANSPAANHGILRGFEILEINGQDVQTLLQDNAIRQALGRDESGVTNEFLFLDLENSERRVQMTKEEIQIQSVLHRETIPVNGKTLGYMVYTNFIESSIPELDEAFQYFENQNIDELAIDLRYNGGGSLGVMLHFANLLAGSVDSGNEFVEITYNEERQDFNESFIFEQANNALDIGRIYFITTPSTASASEALINGMQPYLDVITVGAPTNGKPVGMNVFRIEELAVAPVTFKIENSEGNAEYFSGIQPDIFAPDDLTVPFGHPDEGALQTVVNAVAGETAKTADRPQPAAPDRQVELKGFRAIIGSF